MKWYRTEKGWRNKKKQNNKRSKCSPEQEGRKQQGKGLVKPAVEEKPADAGPEEKGEHVGPARKVEGQRIEHTNTTAKPEGNKGIPSGEEAEGGACGGGEENIVEKGTYDANEIPTRHKEKRNAKPDLQFDDGMVAYLQMALGLIERRNVGRNEVIELLRTTMRQRSMGRERRIDYVLRYLTEHPP